MTKGLDKILCKLGMHKYGLPLADYQKKGTIWTSYCRKCGKEKTEIWGEVNVRYTGGFK